MRNPVKIKEATYLLRHGLMVVSYVAKGDVQSRYITSNIKALKRSGLLPGDFVAVQGDLHLFIVDGVPIVGKVNRSTLDTIAFYWPASLKWPVWTDLPGGGGTSSKVELPAIYVGHTGMHIPPVIRNTSRTHVPGVDTTVVEDSEEPLQSFRVTGRGIRVEPA